MMKQCLFITICALLCAAVASQTTLKLGVLNASNNWWLAVKDIDAAATTETIEMKQGSGDWVAMKTDNNPYWRYWTYQSPNGQPFTFPLSFRLTSTDGKQLTVFSAIVAFTGRDEVVDSQTQYGSASTPVQLATSAPTAAPAATSTAAATSAPVEEESQNDDNTDINSDDYCVTPVEDGSTEPVAEPTDAPLPPTKAPATVGQPIYSSGSGYSAPTDSPTVKPTAAPTQVPTSAPTTTRRPANSAPTSTKAVTNAPMKATSAPTAKAATTAPSNSASGCKAAVKLMVPLYTYPGSTWDTVIANSKAVKTLAIINPDNGPGSKVDSKYTTYIKKMVDAGVEVVGYVHTSYGARSASDVKADIDFYASEYPGVTGIFLDEASSSSSQLAYYKDLHSYIMSMPGYTQNIINPGAVPAAGYMDASTNIVSFESAGSQSIGNPSFASCSNKDHFSAIAYSISSSQINSYIDTLFGKGYFGYVYATSTGLDGGTYNSLPSYYAQMASYVAQKNAAM